MLPNGEGIFMYRCCRIAFYCITLQSGYHSWRPMCEQLLEECCLQRTVAFIETGRIVNWLDDSRRTSALTQANIAYSGTADSSHQAMLRENTPWTSGGSRKSVHTCIGILLFDSPESHVLLPVLLLHTRNKAKQQKKNTLPALHNGARSTQNKVFTCLLVQSTVSGDHASCPC